MVRTGRRKQQRDSKRQNEAEGSSKEGIKEGRSGLTSCLGTREQRQLGRTGKVARTREEETTRRKQQGGIKEGSRRDQGGIKEAEGGGKEGIEEGESKD